MNPPLLLATALALALLFESQAALSVAIDIAPPPLPVYVQPVIPAPGYLWTPGYWGWAGGSYAWHGGYWGPHVGFYGGVNYGFGYVGTGYLGGRWDGGVLSYNRSVNNVDTKIVRNVYSTTIVENNMQVSYNGGQGGIAARPTEQEMAARTEQHVPPTVQQRQHEQVALRTPEQRATFNHGSPPLAATPRPRDLNGSHGGAGPLGPQQMHANAAGPHGPGGAAHMHAERPAADHHEGHPEGRHENAR